VFYYKSLLTKPLRPPFKWNLASWDDTKIKAWCESECFITKSEAGIESFLDRRAILKACGIALAFPGKNDGLPVIEVELSWGQNGAFLDVQTWIPFHSSFVTRRIRNGKIGV
jgi:hypothetical protein